jgi:hypothetical protein
MRVVFLIDDRTNEFIFHWFIYMIAGLRQINKNTSRNGFGCVYGDVAPCTVMELNQNLYNPNNVKPPYNIIFKNIVNFLDFQKQTLDIIKNEYNVLLPQDLKLNDIIIFNYGEQILDNPYHISLDGYEFLRKTFLNNVNLTLKHKDKKYFLSRKKSHLLDGNKNENNIKRRQIINEDELSEKLLSIGIETIFLEDYPVEEKIDIFNNSDTIISPNSGGLTFSLFSKPTTKIIEINVENPNQINHQYMSQCNALNIKYNKFIADKIDENDNMMINIDNFINFINTI